MKPDVCGDPAPDASATMPASGAAGETSKSHPRFDRVGIMGASSASIGVAIELLEAGIPVTVFDVARDALDDVIASVRYACQQPLRSGELTAQQRDRRMALLATTINLHHLKDCDVILDAMGSDTAARAGLVRRLHEVIRRDAIVMTCPSNFGVYHLVNFAGSLGNVLGLRMPAAAQAATEAGPAWEFVPAKATSNETLATATALARSLGKSASFGAAAQ